ncbi:MAG: hypothetical protein BAJALOKI1v1_410013 [Promethearchaeota archaeon]|nr:MAG: hypothetical protein BAJALOKI1v1_410013 [Candidatus Lokiarchaeota archaeon]
MQAKKKSNSSKKKATGTREWASSNVNILYGCAHNCRYCYSKKLAIRFKRKTEETWKIMELNEKKIEKEYRKRQGRVMFPSSHDILPKFKKEYFKVLQKLLESGNSVLITTKPHYEIIKELCFKFEEFKELIQFRFTITSINNELLAFWEPGAPSFEERLKSLKHAFEQGFKTSVSIEPFLDKNPIPLIKKIQSLTSETIWVGKMNYIKTNHLIGKEKRFYEAIRDNISLENITKIINSLKNNKKIRWKDSIKDMCIRNDIQLPSFQTPEVKEK